MTVGVLERCLSSSELAEWAEYYQIEPWGEERADHRNALLCALTVNIHRGKKSPARLEDFMPEFDGRPGARSKQTVLEMQAVMYSAAARSKVAARSS